MHRRVSLALGLALAFWTTAALAQAPRGNRPPQFVSPEVKTGGAIVFRIHAPNAKSVKLASSDLPNAGGGQGPNSGLELKAGDEGVWEATVENTPPGAYRYAFNVDGVTVIDPRNPATSESNSNTWSLVIVPGSDVADTKDVPHGAVAEILYPSKTLERTRRAHVYTPPGYEKGTESYPVFYLLHGAGDCDDSWATVGRAGVILDNLIAAGKAKPMIVVMPAGHTGPFSFGGGGGANSFERQMRIFEDDFNRDLRPHIEASYRVKTGRGDRAIAGLSMGGAQTLNIAFGDLDDYAYVGVYSSGIFGIAGGGPGNAEPNTRWQDDHEKVLNDAKLKEGLKLVWFGCGKDDFLVKTSDETVAMPKKHGFDVTYHETDGGHTWTNWRDYLNEFAPRLFQGE